MLTAMRAGRIAVECQTATRIPIIRAGCPWKFWRHGGKQEVDAVSDYDIVIYGDDGSRKHHGEPDAWKNMYNHQWASGFESNVILSSSRRKNYRETVI